MNNLSLPNAFSRLPAVSVSGNTLPVQSMPPVGHFAATDSEEVVAAGPHGLFYFKCVQGHVYIADRASPTPASSNHLGPYSSSTAYVPDLDTPARADDGIDVSFDPELHMYAGDGDDSGEDQICGHVLLKPGERAGW
ncbi:hypothetical protein GGR52DRAFT_572713 [Hypoxylon sp. FL1284]|nr:hypothetical protein GGR52DRAFT_572713 [Hypoxylon sp. FL1284]